MSQPGLGQQAFKGMQWLVMGRLLKSGLSIVTLAVLSRYLTPAEFGMVALVMFVTGFAQLFVDAGLRPALVQRQEITELQKNTVFWSSLLFSILLCGAVVLFAPQIAAAFAAESIEPLLRWMSLIFPLAAVQGISLTLLERRFAFARLAVSDLIAAVAGSLAAIALVVAGWGIAALVVQQLVQAVLGTLIIMAISPWKPALSFSWAEFRSLISYGGYVLLTNVSTFMTGQLDRPIVAGLLSAEVLGYLAMSRQIISSPFRIISQVVRRVLFPILSSVQDDRVRVGAAYLRIQFAMAAVMAPACLGVAAVSTPLVDVLLGDGWGPVAPLIRILSIQMLFLPIQNNNQTVLASLGMAKFQFRWSLFAGSTSLLAFFLAAPWGIEIALAARVAVTLLTVPTLSVYTMRQIGLNWRDLLRTLAGPLGAAIAMFVAVYWLTGQLSYPPLWVLAICVPLGAGLYTALLFLTARPRAMEVVRLLRKRG